MVGTWHGHGMASVNQTRPHCVNQMGKTHSKPLAAGHGRGTAWARHAMSESALIGICAFEPARQETLIELNCCSIKMKFTLSLFFNELQALKASGRLGAQYISYFDTRKEPINIHPILG